MCPRRLSNIVRGASLLAALLSQVTTSVAQHAPRPGSPESLRPGAPEPTETTETTPLRRLVGVEAARQLIGVDDELAIRRLSAVGTQSALLELARMAEQPDQLTDRALLLLTRALGKQASEPTAVRALYTILVRAGKGSGHARQGGLLDVAREQAALAMASGGTREAQSLLARMVKRGHEDGERAARALIAHPPLVLDVVLKSPGTANTTFVALLEGLSDQRAFHALRDVVRRASPEVSARAALALTRLGALETIELAEHWLKNSSDAEQLWAATEILLQTHEPNGAAAWAKRYGEDRNRAIALALAYPQPRLATPIAKLLDSAGAAQSNDPPSNHAEPSRAEPSHAEPIDAEPIDARLLTVLGHSGGTKAVALLEKYLASRDGNTAAYALARCPHEEATAALERALQHDQAAVKRRAAVAAVLRSRLNDDVSSALTGALTELRSSSERADVLLGIWGSAATNPKYALAQLKSPSTSALAATMLAAPVQGVQFFRSAAEALNAEKDESRRELYALALLHPKAADDVPTHALERLVDDESPLFDLAVAALCSRDDERLLARIQGFVESTSSRVRASAALGLARHPAPWATGKLARALEFEADPKVRLALVAALSHRDEAPNRQEILTATRDFDADGGVRTAARLALAGRPLSLSVVGDEVGWVEVDAASVPAWLQVLSGPMPAVPAPTLGQTVVPLVGLRSADTSVRGFLRAADGPKPKGGSTVPARKKPLEGSKDPQ